MSSGRALGLLAAALLAATALHAAGLRFVREGVLVEGAGLERATDFRANGTRVSAARLPGDKGWLVEWAWPPRGLARIEWAGVPAGAATATAPLRPAPWERWTLAWPPSLWLSTTADDEATALAFAPQGNLLAAGSQQGRVEVFALADGASAWSLQRPGRVIKQVAFDAGAERLYVGEQGPEGRLAAYALAASAGAPVWVLDTAADLGGGAPSDPGDPYAWVTQPGAYRLLRVGGDVVAAFSRSWSEGGHRHARSRLYRLDGESGLLRWAYPAEGAQAGILPWFALDAAGGRLALPVQAPTGAAPGEIRPTEVVLLDLGTGRPVARRPIDALPPYPSAGIWRGLALQPGGGGVAVSSEDGRAFLWQQDAEALQPVTELRLVEPVRLAGIPLTATNGTLAATADAVIFATGPTYVPVEFGGGGEPTLDHPRGNTLYAHDWRGRPRWVWRLDNDLQGLAGDTAGRWLAVAEGAERPQTAGRFHGVALLDLRADAGNRAVFRLALEGRPVYGALALSGDGRWLAVAEAPRTIAGEARPHGAARLHLVR